MKKSLITLATAALMAASMSISAFAATAQDAINKNPTSYTAGTQSVYGPNLSQEQLNAVAQAAADFVSANITDGMDNDTKIRTAHDFLKNNVTYIDWNKGEGANTAYGALAKGQAACSGYARAFKALCDSMDVSCYYIHADATAGNPSHQWNMVEYNDGFYFIDVEANDSSGFDAIYHSSTHPYTCDMSQLPAIGAHSGQNTAGTQATNNSWKQENGKWYYYENGSKAANKWINGTYYVGSDGAMLVNTTTPDGYQVDGNGAWIKEEQSGNIAGNDGVHTKRASDPEEFYSINCSLGSTPWKQYQKENHEGMDCIVLDHNVGTFSFESSKNDLDSKNHQIWIVGYQFYNGLPVAIGKNGEPIVYDFEYDKEYSLDFTGTGKNATQLAEYCINNNIIVQVSVVDVPAFGVKSPNAISFDLFYASTNSVLTGEISQ